MTSGIRAASDEFSVADLPLDAPQGYWWDQDPLCHRFWPVHWQSWTRISTSSLMNTKAEHTERCHKINVLERRINQRTVSKAAPNS
jgi:hypothetical protein